MARRGVASIQEALVGIDRIANGVVWRSDGAACAVLEVAPLTFDLLPEAEQHAVLAGFGAFLNALTHPIQILVRVARLDLEPYLADLTERARREPAAALADLAHDHVAALRDLAASRLLLDRHFYLVIPDEDLAGPRPPRRFPRPRREGAPAAEEPVRRRLAFRCEEAVTRLGRCRLRAWRLDDTALARLYRDCWHQDEPGDRGIRDIAAYTGLTAARAGRHAPAHPPAREETPGPLAEPGAADGVAPDVPAREGRPRRWWRRRPAGRAPAAPDDGRHPDSVRFAEGVRAVADYIAPEAVEIDREWLRLNRVYGRTLAVTNLPPALEAGWLQLLTGGDEPLTVSLHVRPLDTTRMIRDLQRRAVQIQSSQLADERAGKLDDPARRIAFEQIEALRDALQRGDERLFSVGLYLFLAAPSPRALDDRTARVEHLLEGALAQSRRATFEQDSGFRACLPLADDRLRRPRNLETGSVGLLIAFCDSCLTMGRGPVYGLTPEGHGLALLDRHGLDLPNGNTFVCAKAGAGKSFFVKVAALRGLYFGVNCVIVDPELDEYLPLCRAVGGQYVRLALGAGPCINPFDLPPAAERDEPWRNPVAEQTVRVLGLVQLMVADDGAGGALTPRERAVLERATKETYARAGILAESPASWTRPAPTLDDLHAVLGEVPAEAPAGPLAGDLAARLAPFVGDGALAGPFNRPTNVDLRGRLVVFNLGRLDASLHPLAIHAIAGFVWREARRRKARGEYVETDIVIDEAWSLIKHRAGGAFLEDLARRARKYALALVTVTQRAGDFLGDEAGRAVMANATVKFLLQQEGAELETVGALFGLGDHECRQLLAARKGCGYLFALDRHAWLEVVASPAEHRLATTSPREEEAYRRDEAGYRDVAGRVAG